MAEYKVILTVKDRYGNIKEVEGGVVNVGLESLSATDLKALDAHFATDKEMEEAARTAEALHYAGLELIEDDNTTIVAEEA